MGNYEGVGPRSFCCLIIAMICSRGLWGIVTFSNIIGVDNYSHDLGNRPFKISRVSHVRRGTLMDHLVSTLHNMPQYLAWLS